MNCNCIDRHINKVGIIRPIHEDFHTRRDLLHSINIIPILNCKDYINCHICIKHTCDQKIDRWKDFVNDAENIKKVIASKKVYKQKTYKDLEDIMNIS